MKKSERRAKKAWKRRMLQLYRFQRRGGWRKYFLGMKDAYKKMADNVYQDSLPFLDRMKTNPDFCGRVITVPFLYSMEGLDGQE